MVSRKIRIVLPNSAGSPAIHPGSKLPGILATENKKGAVVIRSTVPSTLYLQLAFLLLFPGCIHHSHIAKRKVTITYPLPKKTTVAINEQIATPSITIWIHGTRFLRHPTFYQEFSGIPSLKRASDLNSDRYLSILAHAVSETDPINFPIETFYIFGWSGKLNNQERLQAAICLYKDLQTVITEYKQTYNTYPIIRIIGHSHGGNIALCLAQIKDSDDDLTIESLVLLAVPVQTETMNYINNQLFKHVYALYSGLDMIQVLAPEVIYKRYIDKQGNNVKKRIFKIPPFSARHFPWNPHLIQAKVKINNHAIFHTEFSSSRFAAILPYLLPELDAWHKEELNNYELQNKNKFLCIYKKYVTV